ncbi:MAG: DUF6660 family protein [Bacteroidia bacterium]
MKTLALILSLLVLVLSVVPCCELARAFELNEAKILEDKQHPDAEESCYDECSPFYTCSACGGVMLTQLAHFSSPAPTLIPPSFKHKYFPSFTDDIDQNIWQPPKLS